MFIVLCAQRNQKTPERATIEKPLYFCPAEFVGQFATSDQGLAPMQRRAADRAIADVCFRMRHAFVVRGQVR
jgi:hypothetical protein